MELRSPTGGILIGGILCLAAPATAAAQARDFDIPAGRMADSLRLLGAQGEVTIGASDPALAGIRSRAVKGRMTTRAALDRLLAGTDYVHRKAGRNAVRILRSPRRSPRRPIAVRKPSPVAPDSVQSADTGEIVVTASKQGVSLDHFGATVRIVDLAADDANRFGARGSEVVLDRLPMLASTNLGPGRNKVFIRGVADSSFNGPSQSIVGQYFGDVRMVFNTPDPNLQLYDIRRVEVLEGPQGTLYGTGVLGGIVRLVANPPDPSRWEGKASIGAVVMRDGAPGADVATIVNVPLVRDRLAFRAVAFAATDGGYIDDVGRGVRDTNQVRTSGGRAAIRWSPDSDWEIGVEAIFQDIAGRDGQYAEAASPELSRRTALSQPFFSNYRLGSLSLRKRWRDIELVSATGLVRHDLRNQFDATPAFSSSEPRRYVESIGTTFFSNETRLSRRDARGRGWVVGLGYLHNSSGISRRIVARGSSLSITGVRNSVTETAAFGEYGVPLGRRLTATMGGRFTYTSSSGEPLDVEHETEEPTRRDFRASPSASLVWRVDPSLMAFLRYQQGVRAGGLAVSATGSDTAVQRFESDHLRSIEIGARTGAADSAINMSATLSYSTWSDIQADLIDAGGLPFTTNVGDGRIFGFEVEAVWRPTRRLRIEASGFANNSALIEPKKPFVSTRERDLPNIADIAARLAVRHVTDLATDTQLLIDAALRYVGRSPLLVGTADPVWQGDFSDMRIGARLALRRFAITLDVSNVTNTVGNRFALGNPFSFAGQRQITPLRPRALRIGFQTNF